MKKIIFVFVGIAVLIGLTVLVTSDLLGTAFTITEHTVYDITENIVYINITENLGKDQTINVSSVFKDDELTNSITYKDFKIYTNVTKDTYGFVNTSLGKYAKTNTTTTLIGTGANQTEVITKHYYLSNDTELFCDYVLADKSCLDEEYKVNGTKVVEDYTDLPSTKEKIVIGGLKIENKIGGIVLPKNSKIQLKLTYKHPIAYASRIPSDAINKYDIVVKSINGLDSTTLDPTWWNSNWAYKKQINVSTTKATRTNYTVLINLTYDSDMQADFDDIRFLNSTENGELNYFLGNKVNSNYAEFYVNTPLTQNTNQTIYMYYGNSGSSTTSNQLNVFINTNDHGYTQSTTFTADSGSSYRFTGLDLLPTNDLYLMSIGVPAGVTATRVLVVNGTPSGGIAGTLANPGDIWASASISASKIATLSNPKYISNSTYFVLAVDNSGSSWTGARPSTSVTYPTIKPEAQWVTSLNWNNDLANDQDYWWWWNIKNFTYGVSANPTVYIGSEQTPTCTFSGYVKHTNGSAINGASIVVFNQNLKTEVYNTTSDANGLWFIDIVNSTKNYTVVAYYQLPKNSQSKWNILGTC